MGILGFFRRERYGVQCPHCDKALKIGPETVAVGRYTCTACGQVSPVPDDVREEYRRAHPGQRIRRRAKDTPYEERAGTAAEEQVRPAQGEETKQRAREERLARRRRRQAEWNAALRAGECPACGAQMLIRRKGYNAEAALAGCLLGGPLGLLAGFIGSDKKLRVCQDCGQEFPFASEKKEKRAPIVAIVLAGLLLLLVLGILLTRAL
jgi:hypothetical protein